MAKKKDGLHRYQNKIGRWFWQVWQKGRMILPCGQPTRGYASENGAKRNYLSCQRFIGKTKWK